MSTEAANRNPPRSHALIPASTQPIVPAKITDPVERGRHARASLGGVRTSVSVDSAKAVGR